MVRNQLPARIWLIRIRSSPIVQIRVTVPRGRETFKTHERWKEELVFLFSFFLLSLSLSLSLYQRLSFDCNGGAVAAGNCAPRKINFSAAYIK